MVQDSEDLTIMCCDFDVSTKMEFLKYSLAASTMFQYAFRTDVVSTHSEQRFTSTVQKS